MNSKMSLGQFVPGNSLVHLLDPRIKIFLTIFYMIAIFYVESFIVYGFIMLYLLLIIYVAKLNLKSIIRGLKPLIFIIVFTAILNILATPGKEIFRLWIISFTDEGVYRAVFMAFRIVFLVIGTSFLTLTTSSIMLTDGLESIMKPLKIFKFPAHELAMMISIALRFIPTLFDEADKIRKAQMARGADFDTGNIFAKAKSMVPLLVPLFINSFRRADDLAVAMVSRCYRGSDGRTRLNELRFNKKDILVLILVSTFFVGIILSGKFI